jgi:hypothetical protein
LQLQPADWQVRIGSPSREPNSPAVHSISSPQVVDDVHWATQARPMQIPASPQVPPPIQS